MNIKRRTDRIRIVTKYFKCQLPQPPIKIKHDKTKLVTKKY